MSGWNPWLFSAYLIVVLGLTLYVLSLSRRRSGLLAEEVHLRGRLGVSGEFRSPDGWLADLLGALSLAGLAITAYMGLSYAPTEKTMGDVQRIFYFHVPAAWVAGLAFAVVAGASVVYLVRRSEAADRVAAASAEVGTLFTAFVLITGPIWARPVWYVWWSWDARLTSTLVLFLIYAGYLTLRSQVDEPRRRATLSAVVGILGFLDVPIVYFSIRWWRTQHPQPVIAGGSDSGLAPPMAHAFITGLAAFSVLYLALLLKRAALGRQAATIDELHRLEDDRA